MAVKMMMQNAMSNAGLLFIVIISTLEIYSVKNINAMSINEMTSDDKLKILVPSSTMSLK